MNTYIPNQINNTSTELKRHVFGLFNQRKYVSIIQELKFYNGESSSLIFFHVLSFLKIKNLCGALGVLNSNFNRNTVNRCFYSVPKDISHLRHSIDLLKKYVSDDLYIQRPTRTIIKNTEDFLYRNSMLLIHINFLNINQIELLSNVINVLADQYAQCHKYKDAIVFYEFANNLFPNSFYSVMNYAHIADVINDVELVKRNLLHANYLLYHFNEKPFHIYNPHSGSFCFVSDAVLDNFYKLCRENGVKYRMDFL